MALVQVTTKKSVKSGIFCQKTAVKFDIFSREICWALVIVHCNQAVHVHTWVPDVMCSSRHDITS